MNLTISIFIIWLNKIITINRKTSIDNIYHYIKDLVNLYIFIYSDKSVFSFKTLKTKYNYSPVLFTNKILAILSIFLMTYSLIKIFLYFYTSISILPSAFQVSIFSIVLLLGFLITPLIYFIKPNSSKFQNKYEIKMPTNTIVKFGLTVCTITFSLSIIMAIINNP